MKITNFNPDLLKDFENRLIYFIKESRYTVEKNLEKKSIKTREHFLYAQEICVLLGPSYSVRTPRQIMDNTNFPKYYFAGNRRVYSLDQFLYIYFFLVVSDLEKFCESKSLDKLTMKRGFCSYFLKHLCESCSPALLKRTTENLKLLLEEFSQNGFISLIKLFDLFKNKITIQTILVQGYPTINIFIKDKFININYVGDNTFLIKRIKNINEKKFYIKEGK
jgi:hypothetical protein